MKNMNYKKYCDVDKRDRCGPPIWDLQSYHFNTLNKNINYYNEYDNTEFNSVKQNFSILKSEEDHSQEDIFIEFSRIVVDYIKKRIGINNYDFDTYQNYMKNVNIDYENVLNHVLLKNTIIELIETIKFEYILKYKLKAKRCIQIIALILLKCSDYKCLRICLKDITKLKDKQIRKTIKKYVPLLKKINPKYDISKWLPRGKKDPYTYDKIKKLVETENNGELLEPENEEKFIELAKNYSPSFVPLIVRCITCGYEWSTDAHSLSRGYWCPNCARVEKRLKKEVLYQIAKEKSLKLISDLDEYKDLLTILKWQCLKCIYIFDSNTANVKRAACPCPHCFLHPHLIIWDDDFEEGLKSKIKTIVFNLPLEGASVELRDYIEQESLILWNKLLENGLEPDDMGVDKNPNSLSFSIVYFVLLYMGIHQIGNRPISSKAIYHSLEDNIKYLGIISETQFHTAPSKFYDFLPNDYKTAFDKYARYFELTYERIKIFIEKILGAELKTSEREFYENKERDNTSPVHTKIRIRCQKEHSWTTTYNFLKWHGSWCPDCAQGKYERIIRWYFEKIISYILNPEIIFPNTKLIEVINHVYENDLINSFISHSHFDGYSEIVNFKKSEVKYSTECTLNGYYKKYYKLFMLNNENLHDLFTVITLDYLSNDTFEENDLIVIEFPYGYIELKFLNEELKIIRSELKPSNIKPNEKIMLEVAFEYNGLHHYIYPNYYHSSFRQFLYRITYDLLKKKIAQESGIILIEVPFWICPDMNSPKKIQGFIVSELKNKLDIDFTQYNLHKFNHITQGFYKNESNNFYRDLTDY